MNNEQRSEIMHRRTSTICAIAAGLLAAGAAQADNTSRYDAFPITDNQFEIVADFSENAIYWCGAGDFAIRKLEKDATEKIYVLRGPAQSRAKPDRQAVLFGFAPPDAGEAQTFTNDVSIVGNSLSVSQAKQTCSERSASG
jgi:hypothetical protein